LSQPAIAHGCWWLRHLQGFDHRGAPHANCTARYNGAKI
jgi:hypothetical protein